MEFEPNEKVNEEQRQLAERKKLVLSPMNPFLRPQDTPDPIVVNETLANIDIDRDDTEREASLVQPSPGALQSQTPASKGHSVPAVTTIAVGALAGILLGGSLFLLFR